MSDTRHTWFQQSLDTLAYDRNQRVWSILVTLFGDLARRPGDSISGTTLSAITDPMGIRPEAMRVALHRLRADGWIASERIGRSSRYHLTASGLDQSDAASPRIYGRQETRPDTWHLVVMEPGRATTRSETDKQWRARGYVGITPGTFLGQGDAPDDLPDNLPSDLKNCFVLSGALNHVPAWLQTRLASPEIAAAYRTLEAALDHFLQNPAPAHPSTPVETAILRAVIVHNWRRALLAHPDLPPAFFTKDWRGFACREKVAAALDHLPRPDLQDLEQSLSAA